MIDTDGGSMMVEREVQSWKAPNLIVEIFDGNEIEERFEQA